MQVHHVASSGALTAEAWLHEFVNKPDFGTIETTMRPIQVTPQHSRAQPNLSWVLVTR